MVGAEGIMRKDKMMETLRKSPPKVLGGQDVRKVIDFWDQQAYGPFVSETDKLPRNVIQLFTERYIITIRPSGTEPKLKFYCQLLPDEKPARTKGVALLDEARTKADAISRRIYNELLGIIGVSLSEAALLLPDIVDLDLKERFDKENVPQLQQALKTGKFRDLKALLDWLRNKTAAMTPGADPLPALKAPVAFLCKKWAGELAQAPLLIPLEKWAKQ
jgi:hypothetical protein